MNVEKPCGVSGSFGAHFYHRNDFIGTPDLPGLPADANGRELQLRCCESGDGEKDATSGGGKQRPQPVAEMTFTAGCSQGPARLFTSHLIIPRFALGHSVMRLSPIKFFAKGTREPTLAASLSGYVLIGQHHLNPMVAMLLDSRVRA
jgi:hypothetical protein